MQQSGLLGLKADGNLFSLRGNVYPGRGIIVGLDETGEYLVQVYWIMGRSENSRNRIFSCEGGRVFTEAADPSRVKDPSLIIYNAMVDYGGDHIVSNGDQTDTIVSIVGLGRSFCEALSSRQYEPDSPNFTPRISAISCWSAVEEAPTASMSILRKSAWGDKCDRHLYEINDIGKGFGYCITTYSGDGDPLPAFRGEPYLLPLYGDADVLANNFWEALNTDNKVSLAVKFILKDGSPSHTVIKNKYKKGPFPTLAD